MTMILILIILVIFVVYILNSQYKQGKAIALHINRLMGEYEFSYDNPYGSLIKDLGNNPDWILEMEYNFENYSNYPDLKDRVKEAIDFIMEKSKLQYEPAKYFLFSKFHEIKKNLMKARRIIGM
jgi:hypothetical protein